MLADEGRLPFTRTQGGHKRYRHEDVRRCRISLSQRRAWKVRKLEAKKAAKERITLKNIKKANWVISPREMKNEGGKIEDHRHHPT